MKKLLLDKLLFIAIIYTLYLISMPAVNAQSSTKDTTKAESTSITRKPNPSNKTIDNTSQQYVQPRDIEEYLNKISDSGIPRTVRKKWRQEALQLFAHDSAQVIDEKNGLGTRYSAVALLDLLVDFPHQVKVKEILRDQQDKITEIQLEMNRQSK